MHKGCCVVLVDGWMSLYRDLLFSNQNIIMVSFEHCKLFIKLSMLVKIVTHQTQHSGVLSLTCDSMQMMFNDMCLLLTDRLSYSL